MEEDLTKFSEMPQEVQAEIETVAGLIRESAVKIGAEYEVTPDIMVNAMLAATAQIAIDTNVLNIFEVVAGGMVKNVRNDVESIRATKH